MSVATRATHDRTGALTKPRKSAARENGIPLHLYGLRRGTSTLVTAACFVFTAFTLVPILWLVINSTKTQSNIFNSFGFWFARPFVFFSNFALLFRNVDGYGVYTRWLANTALYAGVGGIGAAAFCTFAGYGFARYRFRGSRTIFYITLSALFVPITAITLPLYLMYTKVHLINSVWGMLLPSMVSPVGVYLMRTFIEASVPQELIDSARMDGAGEVTILFRIALPLMMPGFMTVLLLGIVGIWNNYFLPLVIFTRNDRYPLTEGIGLWSRLTTANGDTLLYPLVVVGGLVTLVPLVALFLVIQRYWKGGLLLGSVVG